MPIPIRYVRRTFWERRSFVPMPWTEFNCYLCGEKIGVNEESERVERGSLILWAHLKCLKALKASERSTGS